MHEHAYTPNTPPCAPIIITDIDVTPKPASNQPTTESAVSDRFNVVSCHLNWICIGRLCSTYRHNNTRYCVWDCYSRHCHNTLMYMLIWLCLHRKKAICLQPAWVVVSFISVILWLHLLCVILYLCHLRHFYNNRTMLLPLYLVFGTYNVNYELNG